MHLDDISLGLFGLLANHLSVLEFSTQVLIFRFKGRAAYVAIFMENICALEFNEPIIVLDTTRMVRELSRPRGYLG